VAEAQDLLVLLVESQGRGVITRHFASSLHRAVAPFDTPASLVPVCRLRKAAGSNTKLFFDGVSMSMQQGCATKDSRDGHQGSILFSMADALARLVATTASWFVNSEVKRLVELNANSEAIISRRHRQNQRLVTGPSKAATSLLSMVNFRAPLAGQAIDLARQSELE
jgi:hypothetical protein